MSRQTQRLFSFSKHDNRVLGYLLLPSWLSALVVIVISAALVIWVILSVINYQGTNIGSGLRQLFNVHTSNQQSFAATYSSLNDNFSASALISYIPLFVFWAGVGLVVYSFAATIVKSIRDAADLKAEMRFVNADRHQLLKESLEHVVIRAVVLALGFVLLTYTLRKVVPYVIAVAHVGTQTPNQLEAAGYVAGGVLLLSVFLHLQVIMLRLLLLKPRVFWQSSYD